MARELAVRSLAVQAAVIIVSGVIVPGIVTFLVWGADSAPVGASAEPGAAAASPSIGPFGAVRAGTPAAVPTPRATAAPSAVPATAVVLSFDDGATDAPIEGWQLNRAATLTTAARPTAVDRSALLRMEGAGSAAACHSLRLPVDGVTLEVRFQLVGTPSAEIPLLTVVLDDEAALTLTAAADGLLVGESTVALDRQAWYDWRVRIEDGSYDVSLASEGGTPTARATGALRARALESLCATVRSGLSLYLDEVTAAPTPEGG